MASKTETQSGNAQTIAVVRERDDDLASIALTWFVQVTALAAAITFGIFSVLSWTAAENAREQANTANLVALAALCGNVVTQSDAYNTEVQGFCNQLFPYAWNPLAVAVAKAFPDIGHIAAPQAPLASSSTVSTMLSSTTPSSTSSSTGFSSTTELSSSLPSGSSTSRTGAGGVISSIFSAVPSSIGGHTGISTSTSVAHLGSSTPTAGNPSSSSGTSAGLGTGAKIGLGVGFAIGVPVVLVSLLTFLRYRKLHQRKIS